MSLGLFEGLFGGAGVVVEELSAPPEVLADLHAEEIAHAARFADTRRDEFHMGRICARRAMRQFGQGDAPLAAGEDRAPLWPAGLTGSITHTKGYAATAVARRGEVRSLGIDVERISRVRPALWGKVLTDGERAALAGVRDEERQFRACLAFSAKEACYKAQYVLEPRRLDFLDLEIQLERGGFIGVFSDKLASHPAPTILRGRFRRIDDLVATAVIIAD